MMNSSSLDLQMFGPYTLDLAKALILINTIVSLPLNTYVMFLILRGASLAQDAFSLNLAVSEALFSLLSLTLFGFLELNSDGPLHEIFTFSTGLIYTARPLFQCFICVEYYIGVVHPVFFLRCRPLRYRAACCGVGWLITLTGCISAGHFQTDYLYSYFFFVQNVLLFPAMVFCCVSVLRALRQPGPGEGRLQSRGGNTVKRRAFKIILLIMFSLEVNILLHMVTIPLQSSLSTKGLYLAWQVCNSLVLLTGFTQQLLYLHRVAKLDCCWRT